MVIGARIVDAKTGGSPSFAQHVIRYLGYFVSTIPFCLGLIWVGIDKKKQGWHDKLAGTVVVRPKYKGTEPVRFG
ncbi:RDD family protein [Undibacterium arcticum]